tara:strand:- start:2113 stop:3390 length:1278 start_codon:yes stop_codon:yes gene_type:complete
MSEIRVDTFKAEDGISAPSFPNGIQVTGVVTATVLDSTVPFLNAGNNIQLGAAGIITATELKATNVSVAGTLTYEDVTNIDSVGIITAREGVFLPDPKQLKIGNTASDPDLKIHHSSGTNIINSANGDLHFQHGNNNKAIVTGGSFKSGLDGSIDLGESGAKWQNVHAVRYYGDGSNLTGIDATALKDPAGNVKIQAQASGAVHTGISTFSGAITASGGVVGNVTGNVSGSAGSIDVGNVSSNSTYYPMFVDNNGSAKSVYIDNGTGLTFNPSTNVLTAGTVKGKGTVEVHTYSINSAGDVGTSSNFFSWNMTPSIDWNRCVWAHSGAHRAVSDTYYYVQYFFNKGDGTGDHSQGTRGYGRSWSGTSHNQNMNGTGPAIDGSGNPMTGSANTQCTFTVQNTSGGNSSPANDAGHDHQAWVMFFHD